MGLRAGRQGVREQPDLRLVPQEHEGRRHALQHLQGRAENLYHDQLHDAAVRRGGDAQTIAHGHPAQDGRPVPFDQGALPEHVGRRTREDRAAGDALLRPLPRPQRGGAQRGRDRPHLPHALPHAGLHLPRRTRHDPLAARLDPPPQTHHARRIRRHRTADGPRQGLRRRPQLPLFQIRHGQAGQAADRLDDQTLRLYIRHRPPRFDAPARRCPTCR